VLRTCSLCLVPKVAQDFNDRANKPAVNCSKCERVYSALHMHCGCSMSQVRGNIHKYGGPTALLSAFKRTGADAVDKTLVEKSYKRRRAGPPRSVKERAPKLPALAADSSASDPSPCPSTES
jgi:hypothetical protein